MKITLLAAAITALAAIAIRRVAAGEAGQVSLPLPAAELEKIAAMLPEKPAGFGRPIADRAAWDTLAKSPAFQRLIASAEALLKQPLPDSPDDLYLDYSKTGNRGRWESVAGRRRGRITTLVLAECMEDKKRFLPALEETIAAICAERTWVMPAHDGGLANFHGRIIDIDLGSSHLGWNLTTADWLLGEKLSARTRSDLRDNVRRRILEPYLDMVAGRRKGNWWMTGTNNWNAVCLAGVTGAGLAMVESRRQRAVFVAAAMKYSENFLAGFTADGYCSEGLGYWNYGFGYYVLLAEQIWQATGGRIDLLTRAEARAPATFPRRIEIADGVYPAFADCGVDARPSSRLTTFLSRRLGLAAGGDEKGLAGPSGYLYEAMMYSLPNSATRADAAPTRPAGAAEMPARDWFDKAGVLVCRPGPAGASCRLAAALKGGHNAEHHNHNDVGSYVVVVAGRPVLLDPGAEVYTARTFSARRYDSKVLNSYGHPVPVVAGRLQRTGRQAQAKVLRVEFTDATDTLALDIASAYDCPQLKKLQRTFSYTRQGAGALTVTDEVAFAEPGTFETALVTLGKWKALDPRTLLIQDGEAAVRVQIDAGGEFELVAEEIREDVRTRSLPTRIGIRLKGPVAAASVALRIAPT